MEVMIEPSGTSASKRTSILAELRELRSRAAPKTEVDLFPGAIVKAAKAALASKSSAPFPFQCAVVAHAGFCGASERVLSV
jgi:hypothetical protein